MAKKTSKFDTWFREQHGKLPTRKSLVQLRRECNEAKARYNKLDRLLFELEIYEAKRTSALYAWNIKDREKVILLSKPNNNQLLNGEAPTYGNLFPIGDDPNAPKITCK